MQEKTDRVRAGHIEAVTSDNGWVLWLDRSLHRAIEVCRGQLVQRYSIADLDEDELEALIQNFIRKTKK